MLGLGLGLEAQVLGLGLATKGPGHVALLTSLRRFQPQVACTQVEAPWYTIAILNRFVRFLIDLRRHLLH